MSAAQSQDSLTPKTSAPTSDQLNLSTSSSLVGSDANRLINFSANKASTDVTKTPQLEFRIERLPLAGGAELLTVFGRLRPDGNSNQEAPLISVVRDTLGDNSPENDRLRYVWMLTYTKPTLGKRIASAIPFLYRSVSNETRTSNAPPSPLFDLTNIRRQAWKKFFVTGLQRAFFDNYGLPLKASSRAYRRNVSDYRRAHVMQVLSILNTYENLKQRTRDESELLAARSPADNSASPAELAMSDTGNAPLFDSGPGFTASEMLELRARLILSQKTFGGLYGVNKFHDTVEAQSAKTVDISGHNWELLRQRAEADGLYFEPLTMPDGTATHALLWIAKTDLVQGNHRFGGRFLNIHNPWTDQELREWKGYTETRYFDNDNRRVSSSDPNGHSVELIPLALYGLTHPRIPALLVDFRANLNAKKREMSGRVLNDIAKNVLSLSSFGNLPYFAGRKVYGFLTGRRGMDVNQPSRLRSYSEFKLLLAFNSTINPKLHTELERRLESVSLNPLTNDSRSEIELARQQYDALIKFAGRPDGLAAKIERDRRAEMMPLAHGRVARFFFGLGNVLSFGRYVHREMDTPDLAARLDLARRLEHHTEFLQQVAKSSPQIEVVWNMADVRASLRFLAEHGNIANNSAARAAAKIFGQTNDSGTRMICLDVLSRVNDKSARNEMLRIYRDQQAQSEWRASIAERLRKAVADDVRIKPSDAKAVLSEVGQP